MSMGFFVDGSFVYKVYPDDIDYSKLRRRSLLLQCGRRSAESNQIQQFPDIAAVQIAIQAYAAARTVYASATSRFPGAALQTAAGELSRHFGRKTRSTTSDAEPTPGSPPPVPTPVT